VLRRNEGFVIGAGGEGEGGEEKD
jgi:hypothetical protein